MKYTDIKLQTLQDKDLIKTIENKIRVGKSSVISNSYIRSDEN